MRGLIFAFFCLLLVATEVGAAPKSVFLEELTWTELRDAIAAGKTTIIIPVGGTEQSGPLLALGKHNVRVHFLAGKIAENLGDAIVAPVMAYVPEGNINPPTEHMKFPGTITISDQLFEQVLESAARGFKQNGFKHIVLIGDHGSYQSDFSIVSDKLNKQWANTGVKAHYIHQYYRAAQDGYVAALLAHGFKKSEIGSHAGLADTSLMLAVEPRLVRSEALSTASHLGVVDGVYGGDPTRSSAELGQLGVDLIIRETVDAIRLAIHVK
jgi:creatinine amidohydrolase/Fe(II)-dependent formamide hydrolase-like protein